ncbi:hypothetical protein RclHR1_00910014 [Rhizophagus clarus]|uniref:Basic-leucine zipper transcription factor n=1 Tax=Rhizophagus clarus TaxID=94130 RepID=A0A2Z6S395_9GLOM|nr:hypothetical protein RclHR1_00910014 [Rhizophagus clarus]GES75363.1 basic-leucine zipper transcription factor [Rhizophagus clarus]
MSVVAKTPVTVVAGSRGYPEYDHRHYSAQMSNSESGSRINIQNLINEPVVRNAHSIEQYHHFNHHHRNSEFNQYSSQHQHSLPPQQHQHQHHQHQHQHKLPTPITSPTSIPIASPSLAPNQSYSPTNSTPSTPSVASSKSDDQNSYMTTIQPSGMIMPLSLQERRERNKIASAKYRAKKHRQNQEMSTTIAELSAENNVLLRQIEEVKTENLELKETIDKLKSKLVEGKILKRLGRGGAKLTLSPTSMADDDLDITTTIRKNSTKRGGFSSHAKGTGPSTKSSRK